MSPKTTNLRFLLSLGGTKMVILQQDNDLQIYSNQTNTSKIDRKATVTAEHVTEALIGE